MTRVRELLHRLLWLPLSLSFFYIAYIVGACIHIYRERASLISWMQGRTTDPWLTQPLIASTQQFNPVGGEKKKNQTTSSSSQKYRQSLHHGRLRGTEENVQTNFGSKQKTKKKKKKKEIVERSKEKGKKKRKWFLHLGRSISNPPSSCCLYCWRCNTNPGRSRLVENQRRPLRQ